MLWIIIALGLLFIGMAYLVNEKNAKYLLSGYNTMSESEQDKVEIKPYLKHFKRFHIFLGVSFIALGIIIHLINKNWSGLFIGIYPLLAYIYFLWSGRPYFPKLKGSKTQTNAIIGLIIIIVSVVFVLILFLRGNHTDELIIKNNKLIIEGFYGEEIPLADLDSVLLVNELPKIIKRSNGYASGDVRKGYFQTEKTKRIKLILNSNTKPYILIKTKNKQKIYYSLNEEKNKELFSVLTDAIGTAN